MKKTLPAVLIVVAWLAAACVGTPTPAPTQPPAAPTTAPPTVAATTAPTPQPPAEEITLNIICRCVAGGVNANTVKWLTESVIPKFEAQMRQQGQPVDVNLVSFGGSDEELKQQYALDLSVGQGSDVMAFDGFWVPEFVSGGLLKPLNVVAGPSVDEWEGWSHIPDNIQALLSYQGERYGIPVGTDARAIWYRKDLLQQAGLPEDWQPTSWDELLDAARAVKAAHPAADQCRHGDG